MALEWFEGFEDMSATFPPGNRANYAQNTDWTTVAQYQVSGRFADSKAVSSNLSGSANFRYFMKTATTSVACAASITQSTRADPTASLYSWTGITLEGASTANNLNVAVNSAGAIVVFRGTSGTANTLITTASGLVSAGTWYHLGVEVVRSATVGTCNVYLNGVQVVSLTGANTGSDAVSSIVCASQNNVNVTWDDFYVCDVATWLGECRSSPLVPTSDVSVDFTPSTGSSNYAVVDELPPDTSDYVYSDVASDRDLYGVTDLSFTPLSIAGVKTSLLARKDDISTRTFRSVLKSGSTTATGATTAAQGSYSFSSDIFPTDPDTSSAWTKSGVDALQIGFEIVT